MIWRGDIDVTIQSYSEGHIDSIIRLNNEDGMWRFTGFYGNPIKQQRSNSWKLLKRLAEGNQLP